MKKLNKKGFTLIELLAVIIILGVLMIIAIPSVTTYIQNSRKSAYVDTADAYISAVRTKVNQAKDLKLFNPNVLYLIPVNQTAEESCVAVESGGQSPYNDKWNYAYVGVKYKATSGGEASYEYFFIGEDQSNQGIAFSSQKDFSDEGSDLVYASLSDADPAIDETAHTLLKTNYKQSKVYGTLTKTGVTIETLDAKLATALGNSTDTPVTNVEFVAAPACKNLM